MKFSKNLKIMFSSLVLAPFMMFGYTSATENVDSNKVEGEIQCDVQDGPVKVFFTDVNGNLDKNLYLTNFYIQSYGKNVEIENGVGFRCNLMCKRLDNLIQLNPLIQKYSKVLLKDLKFVIKKLNSDEIVDEKKIDSYYAYCNEKETETFIDSLSPINLFTVEDGTYDVYLYNGDEMLGSFKNVKFEKVTK